MQISELRVAQKRRSPAPAAAEERNGFNRWPAECRGRSDEGSSIMIKKSLRFKLLGKIAKDALAALCCLLLLQIDLPVAAQSQQKPDSPTPKVGGGDVPPEQQEATVISPEQLDSLVAPIALYPDPMLAQ